MQPDNLQSSRFQIVSGAVVKLQASARAFASSLCKMPIVSAFEELAFVAQLLALVFISFALGPAPSVRLDSSWLIDTASAPASDVWMQTCTGGRLSTIPSANPYQRVPEHQVGRCGFVSCGVCGSLLFSIAACFVQEFKARPAISLESIGLLIEHWLCPSVRPTDSLMPFEEND